MKFAKGAVQGSLSRGAVDWMVRTVDLSTYINQWNEGVRHIFSNLFLFIFKFSVIWRRWAVYSKFSSECWSRNAWTFHGWMFETEKKYWFCIKVKLVFFFWKILTLLDCRMSQWMYGSAHKCGSKTVRHAICLLGIEDLRTVAAYPNLMFNKVSHLPNTKCLNFNIDDPSIWLLNCGMHGRATVQSNISWTSRSSAGRKLLCTNGQCKLNEFIT